jgi:hypothetical protein
VYLRRIDVKLQHRAAAGERQVGMLGWGGLMIFAGQGFSPAPRITRA